MKVVFADTVYWIAVARPDDQYSLTVRRIRASLGDVRLLTTEEVLTEFLAALSSGGRHMRQLAVEMVEDILTDPAVEVAPQSHRSFLAGVHLYARRLDKQYSLVDCISMNTMRSASVREILTNDHHFDQEGFTILIK